MKRFWSKFDSGKIYMFYVIFIIIIFVINLVIIRKPKDDILPLSTELKRKRIAQCLLNIVQLTSVCGAISCYLLASVQP